MTNEQRVQQIQERLTKIEKLFKKACPALQVKLEKEHVALSTELIKLTPSK